ncbi:ribonuclease H-like domain-containing protein [Tanacetum coccineum]
MATESEVLRDGVRNFVMESEYYTLWDVIENGNSFKSAAQTTTNADGISTSLIPGLVTTEEKVQKKNNVKARSMLLMALPNEHLMIFNQYKDAKTLFAAIQTRFGGNEATKKTQKTLLKQMYENFSALSTESLDSIFNRLQKIVSQLAILGENISQEDLNLKFLRSLPSEWNTHIMVWRNKPDLDTMSFDDLYNNFKIVEQEVKRTTNSSSSSISQNMAFMSSPSSTNEVNTVYGVSTANTQISPASTQVSTASTQVSTANLKEMDLKWQLALLSMRTKRFFQKTSRKITINGSDTARYDKSKVKCFNCHKMGHFTREYRGPRNQDSRNRNQDSSRRTVNVEETSSKAMVAIDGAGFDWSYMADDEVPTNMALMAFSDSEVHNDKTCSKTCLKSFETLKTQLDDLRIEFNKSEFNLATYKRGLASVEEQFVFYKKNEVIFCEQLAVLKRDISYKDLEIIMLKSELEKLKQEKESNQLKIENFDNASKKEFQQPEFEGYGPKTSKSVSEDISNEVKESPDVPLVEELVSDDKLEKKTVFPTVAKIEFVRPKQQEKPVRKPVKYAKMYRLTAITIKGKGWNMVPKAVLMKTCLRPLNIARPVNTAHPKTTIYSARPMSSRPKAVNTVRPNSAVVNVVKANQVNVVKASACWVWRPTKLNSALITLKRHNYVDARGRSKSGNLSDFKDFDGGYVTFGGEPKEGSEGFYQIVDFLNASHIRYALTENPTIYVSPIKQFWKTATTRTLDNGEIELTATIDGTVKTVTEASIRRHLQLADADGISSLPTTEIFEQLSLMGEDIPLFPAMIVQGPVVQGEGSTHPVESHHTPTSAPSTSQPPASLTSRRITRQESVVSQPRSPTHTLIADETIHEERGDSVERAATTATSLDAEQGSGNINRTQSMAIPNDPFPQGISSGGSPRRQDTILGDRPAQTRFERLSKQSNDSPLPRVNTLGSDEGSMTQQELIVFYTTLLIKKVKKLEKTVKSSQARRRARIVVSDDEDELEDPSKQGRKIAEIDQDPSISLVQHDAEIQGRYEHDMEFEFVFDAAKEVSTAEKDVSTAEQVSTVGEAVTTTSVAVSTASPTRNTRVSTADDITMAETLVYIR